MKLFLTLVDTATFPNNRYAMFYNGCLMKDSIDDAVASQVRNILGSLKEAIEMRLKPLLANPCFDLKAHMQVVANLLGDANCKWLQNK